MVLDTSKLIASVTNLTTVQGSVLKLINDMAANQKDLAQKLADAIAAEDPVAIAAVQKAMDDSAAAVNTDAAALAAAVTANTPPTTEPTTPTS